ncbi:hypothetical protein [Mitsuokella multacida]|uniref:hypothetical protein n=1 Tax=Mitsuokella multacida TaxID=52226 RepID=UPI00265DC040|nr:hypothetical protein [Mitsuokella multacida]
MNTEGLYTREKVENMNTVEIIKYMNDNFGGLNNFYVYARIVEITDENIVTIPEYFLMNDNGTAQKAIITSDEGAFQVKMIREDNKRNRYVKINGTVLDVNKHIIYSMLFMSINNKNDREMNKRDINNIFIFTPSLIVEDGEQAETIRTWYRDNEIKVKAKDIFFNQTDCLETIILRPFIKNLYQEKDRIEAHTLENLENEIEENKQIIEKQKADIEEYNDDILGLKEIEENNNNIIEKQKENIKGLEKEYKIKELSLSKELENKLEGLKSKIKFFEEFLSPDFNNETINIGDFNLLKSYNDFNEMVTYMQSFLWGKYHLFYSQDILKSFYLGIQTGQLILLVGHPGSGKSSLAQYFPTAFGSLESVMIPVQPSWSDREDLLGYYNSLEKMYVSTTFLDELIKTCHLANQYKNQIFFMCLDEMNLAHVEYYFAEFLSILQGDRVLNLYSKNIENDIKIELQYNGFATSRIDPKIFKTKEFKSLDILKKKYYLSLCRMAAMIAKYPAKIKIPSNIIFIGTLNQDATTHDISPKVLDRSFVIRLENQEDQEAALSLDIEDFPMRPVAYKPLSEFNPIYSEDEVERHIREIKNTFKQYRNLDDIFKFSTRVMNATFANEDFSKWCQVESPDKIIDYIYSAMFLPRLRLDEETFSKKRDVLDDMSKKMPLFDRIYHMSINDGELDYWRE